MLPAIPTGQGTDEFLDGPTYRVRGGVAFNQRGKGACTLGPTVAVGISGYFLVNSHCTSTWGGVDTANLLYQPDATNWIGGGGKTTGTESVDPVPTPCPDPANPAAAWPRCRYSDAALVRWTDSVLINDLHTFGEIAKPVERAAFRGSTDLVPNDKLEVSSQLYTIANGMTLDKIGRVTGWTYGVVTDNDIDVLQNTGVFLLDQVEFTANSFAGDSGSPVFEWWTGWVGSGGPAVIAGIYWGGYFDQSLSYFSPVDGIQLDLGNLNFF